MAPEAPATPFTGEMQIEVIGSDLDGSQFIERTQALTPLRGGAIIPLANKLAPDSELILRNPLTNEEALARVVGLIRQDACANAYGVAFVVPWVDLWHIEYPASVHEMPTQMECSKCQTVELVPLSEIEVMVLASNKGLMRRCECANSATLWKQTDREVTAHKQQARTQSTFAQEVSLRPPQERRQRRRPAMKSTACIRVAGREELAECENVSRGGFRFKSRQAYPEGTFIDAAVPYAENGVNIFLTGQIAYKSKASGGYYRHGVAYLKASNKK